MAGLTDKQEAFAVKFVECNDASEAYRFAYDAENMAPPSVHVNASKLLKHAKVALRVSELKSKANEIAEESFTISVQTRLEWLKEIVEAGLSPYADQLGNNRRENLAAAKGAIETMNAMLGVGEDGEEAKAMTITFGTREPVGDIKITKGK